MVTHSLVRATIPGQRESRPSLYHISSLQGLWGWLLLQGRLSQILLCVLCLTHQITVLVPTDHLLHPSCSLTCLWAVTTGRRHFKIVHTAYSGDLLDKHAIYFTEKKQCFTPRILKTSHQPFLVKYRYYNPPSRKRNSPQASPDNQWNQQASTAKREKAYTGADINVKSYTILFSNTLFES